MSRKGTFDHVLKTMPSSTDAQVSALNETGRRMSAASSAGMPTRHVSAILKDVSTRAAQGDEYKRKADELQKMLAAGQTVLEIDPALVDPSPIRDRLPRSAAEDAEFVESVREVGQQVPALLRRNPASPERYLTVFGHRRTSAAATLGRPLKAVVVEMSDKEAFVAQGIENNAREDLCFIERAIFARKLLEADLEHKAIAQAVGTARPHVVVMLAIARELPDELLLAVGRSPALGRPRWEAFKNDYAAAVDRHGGSKVEKAWRTRIQEPDFNGLDDVGKMNALAGAIAAVDAKQTESAGAKKARELKDSEGVVFATVQHSPSGGSKMSLKRDKDLSFRPDKAPFAEWLEGRLADLRSQWRNGE